MYFLQQVDRALSRASPFAAVGVVVGTVYWSAVTYGAVTVMQVQWASNMLHRKSVKPESVTVSSPFSSYYVHVQVVGHKKGLYVMERADPLFLLMGLPTIPVVLVLGKMIRWEDYIVRLWQRYCYKGTLPPGINTNTYTYWALFSFKCGLIQANIHLIRSFEGSFRIDLIIVQNCFEINGKLVEWSYDQCIFCLADFISYIWFLCWWKN